MIKGAVGERYFDAGTVGQRFESFPPCQSMRGVAQLARATVKRKTLFGDCPFIF